MVPALEGRVTEENRYGCHIDACPLRGPARPSKRGAIAGFWPGYSGNTRVSYTTDLRWFAGWCADNRIRLLDVRRAHLEMFARTMEQDGRMRSTVARRLSSLCSFYGSSQLSGQLPRSSGSSEACQLQR